MRFHVVAFAIALLAAGCGARSDLPADVTEMRKGFLLTQGSLSRWVRPVEANEDAIAFYDYTSKSAHTGFEAVGKSELFLYRDGMGNLSLVTEHGIDVDATGLVQPASRVNQTFTGLPAGVSIALADDNATELHMDSPTSAIGAWNFNQNTDGGIFSGLPAPGNWAITITSEFIEGIDGWRFIDRGHDVALDLVAPVTVASFD